MSPKDALRLSIGMSDYIVNAYINDLDDADLLIRPVPGMNHIAWQLGHLIAAERRFSEMVKPDSCPPLPAGFEEAHSKETIAVDDPSKFHSRAEYQNLWKKQRGATLAVLEAVPESQLDKTDPEKYPEWAPTCAALLAMSGTHALMHCGQWVAVRRQLGKPVVI
jgi:DinB superfamily